MVKVIEGVNNSNIETDYGNLTLIELKFQEMRREVGRISEIATDVKNSLSSLIGAINTLAGLVGASPVSSSASIGKIEAIENEISSFTLTQIERYAALNEITYKRVAVLDQLLMELFDKDGQLVTYKINGEEVTENFTTLLKNEEYKEKREALKQSLGLLTNMIVGFEGSTPVVGDKYKISVDPGNTTLLAVGNGLLLGSNSSIFAKHGIDVSKYQYGDLLDIATVNAVRDDIIDNTRNEVINYLEKNGIFLENHQIDALTSRKYNMGDISGFVNAYKKYGDTDALYDNYLSTGVYGQNGKYFPDLAVRRQVEWNLFHNGIYPEN